MLFITVVFQYRKYVGAGVAICADAIYNTGGGRSPPRWASQVSISLMRLVTD